MVPRVEYINGTKMTTWDSRITDIDFGLFVKEYHLTELLIVMAVMIASAGYCWCCFRFPLCDNLHWLEQRERRKTRRWEVQRENPARQLMSL